MYLCVLSNIYTRYAVKRTINKIKYGKAIPLRGKQRINLQINIGK